MIAALIHEAARHAGLNRALLVALVEVESEGNPFAWNPEPTYRWLWNVRTQRPFRAVSPAELRAKYPPADFPAIAGDRDQEWWAQQASWGLCQVMGAVARERGFSGPYLPAILDPAVNLGLGADLLASLLRWANGDRARALGAYNAGRGGWNSPQGRRYAAKVLGAVVDVG